MKQPAVDPGQFNACIADALDYIVVKFVELGIQVSPSQLTKVRADIEDFTMTAIEAAILPHAPADWSWQQAARLISMEMAKQHVREVASAFGIKPS